MPGRAILLAGVALLASGLALPHDLRLVQGLEGGSLTEVLSGGAGSELKRGAS